MERSFMLILVLITLIATIAYVFSPSTVRVAVNESEEVKTSVANESIGFNFTIPENVTGNVVSIEVPAVDNEGRGVTVNLTLEVIPGKGRALTNINQILFWVDTQHSIRTALKVASNVTGINVSKYDFIYSISTNASVIEGTSAGAALTVLTIAALLNKTINPNVTITGTINHDGTIGPVGQVLEKGKAASRAGKKIFLVPLGQGSTVKYVEKKHCEKYGFVTFCTTELIPKKVSISKEVGIRVVEVGNIHEALNYLLANK